MRRTGGAAVLVAALAIGVTGCAEEKADPAQERLDRVETRLGATFSASQARCILDGSDTSVIRALDRTADLPADSPVLAAYTEVVAACVEDPDRTTSAPDAPTTTAPAGTSTTGG